MVKRKEKASKPDPAARLIWQRMLDVRPSRKLDYASIARAAMKIADDTDVEQLSMRNLAAQLGAGTMSLYRYVRDKDDLWDLILDAAFGEISLPAKTSKDWRRDLAKIAIATRRMMLRHPWTAALVTRRPTLGPNYLRWFECLLAATAAPNRVMHTQVRMIGTVWAFLSGFVAYEVGEQEANRRHKLTEESKRELVAPYIEHVLATGKFPNLARFVQSNAETPSDETFEFGLRAVLDGLTARKASRP